MSTILVIGLARLALHPACTDPQSSQEALRYAR